MFPSSNDPRWLARYTLAGFMQIRRKVSGLLSYVPLNVEHAANAALSLARALHLVHIAHASGGEIVCMRVETEREEKTRCCCCCFAAAAQRDHTYSYILARDPRCAVHAVAHNGRRLTLTTPFCALGIWDIGPRFKFTGS